MSQRKNLREAVDNPYVDAAADASHFIPKGIWSILGLGMLALSIYCTVALLQDYLQFPSYTEISSEFVAHYHLPAITICNINRLNRTKMEEGKKIRIPGRKGQPQQLVTPYYLYKALGDQYKERSGPTSKGDKIPFEKLNEENINRLYRWDIGSNIKYQYLTFAKDPLPMAKKDDYYKEEYTEMGNCLEINDKQVLVQRVNGAIGGLSMVLDTETEHYLDSTESEGFYVVLRMPNETVVNKEYAFRVSPGREWYIQLQTTEVTRLGPPYGNCFDDEDIFKTDDDADDDDADRGGRVKDTLSIKECYSNQVLWLYMREPLCKCYPWYIYSRYLEVVTDRASKSEVRNTVLEQRLKQYYSQGIREDKRINFDNDTTCFYADQNSYSGTALATMQSITSQYDCAKECRAMEDCVLFMWTDPKEETDRNDAVGGQCVLFDGIAQLSEDLNYKVQRGATNCTDRQFSECDVSTERLCENTVIDILMSNDTERQPLKCQEPCTYNKTSYTLSSSNFPSKRHWDDSLKHSFDYETYAEAKRNLIKLVFFQEVLTSVNEVQVAAYNWRNFVGELGGTVDLFIGISVMTIIKLLEWLGYYIASCCNTKKQKEDDDDSKDYPVYANDQGVKMNNLPEVS